MIFGLILFVILTALSLVTGYALNPTLVPPDTLIGMSILCATLGAFPLVRAVQLTGPHTRHPRIWVCIAVIVLILGIAVFTHLISLIAALYILSICIVGLLGMDERWFFVVALMTLTIVIVGLLLNHPIAEIGAQVVYLALVGGVLVTGMQAAMSRWMSATSEPETRSSQYAQMTYHYLGNMTAVIIALFCVTLLLRGWGYTYLDVFPLRGSIMISLCCTCLMVLMQSLPFAESRLILDRPMSSRSHTILSIVIFVLIFLCMFRILSDMPSMLRWSGSALAGVLGGALFFYGILYREYIVRQLKQLKRKITS